MQPLPNATAVQSALDFEGLGKLRAQARQSEQAAVRETAQQFEALFVQMMLRSMRETVDKSELSEGHGQETFEAMFDREVGHQIARRGALGLADMLVRDHAQRSRMVSSAEALAARPAMAAPAPMALDRPTPAYPLPGAAAGLPLPPTPGLRPLPAPGAGVTGGSP